MRPGDLYLLVPPPAGATPLLLQRQWLAAVLVGTFLTLLGAFIRDVHRRGGFWKWLRRGIETADEFEGFLDRRASRVATRRMRKLESDHEQREYKRRTSSRGNQLKLFRW